MGIIKFQFPVDPVTFCWECVCMLSHSVMSDPLDCSPPGSSVHGIFQARILEWVALSFSRGSSPSRDQTWVPSLQVDSLHFWETNLNFILRSLLLLMTQALTFYDVLFSKKEIYSLKSILKSFMLGKEESLHYFKIQTAEHKVQQNSAPCV